MAISMTLVAARIDSLESGFAGGHLLAAGQRFTRGALDFCGDFGLELTELALGDAFFFEILLVQPDRVAFAPGGKQIGGKRFPRFALVVCRVPSHAKRLGNEQRRSLSIATPPGRDSCSRMGVEDVVAEIGRASCRERVSIS